MRVVAALAEFIRTLVIGVAIGGSAVCGIVFLAMLAGLVK